MHMRQSERIKGEKAQAKRGDDIDPHVKPDHLVPVARFEGSRLASGASPSPFQNTGSFKSGSKVYVKKKNHVGQATSAMSVLDIKPKQSGKQDNKGTNLRAPKVARLSTSGASVSAAVVEAENILEDEIKENKDELKAKLKDLLREKSDVFNSDNQEEDKVHDGVVENVAWHLRHEYMFGLVGDDHQMLTWDLRTPTTNKPVQSVAAHDAELTNKLKDILEQSIMDACLTEMKVMNREIANQMAISCLHCLYYQSRGRMMKGTSSAMRATMYQGNCIVQVYEVMYKILNL